MSVTLAIGTLVLGSVSYSTDLGLHCGNEVLAEFEWIESPANGCYRRVRVSKGGVVYSCHTLKVAPLTPDELERLSQMLGDSFPTSTSKFYAPGLGYETFDVEYDDKWMLPPSCLDYHRSIVHVPLWLPLLVFLVFPAVAFIRGPLRRWRHRREGFCAECGYNLTGNVSGVCPECGERI